MKKIFVLDTNILLHDPNSINNFGKNEIVLPAIVLEELDNKKREQNEIGKNARQITRVIKELRKGHEGQLSKGVPLENGGVLRVELNHRSFEKLRDIFGEETNDNRIIAVAKNLYDEEQEKDEKIRKEVVLVSNDGLVIAKADALELNVEMYEKDRIDDVDNIHTGNHTVSVPKEIIDTLYKNDEVPFEKIEPFLDKNHSVFVQDFFILKSLDGSKQSGLARLIVSQGKKVLTTLVVESKEFKDEYDDGVYGITPRNVQQIMTMELLMDPHVPLVALRGPAGTGKTLLALAAGLQQATGTGNGSYKKILAARSVIPVGKDIGYLPGDMNEKLRPWMQPIYDNLEFLLGYNNDEDEEDTYGKGQKRSLEDEVEQLNIQVEALTYIRGRSIPKQFIIIDESQNLSPYEVKTIISRAGEDTKIILLGDPEQIDHPYLDSTNNGLTHVIERMKQEHNVGIVYLEKTERSSLAEKAAKLL